MVDANLDFHTNKKHDTRRMSVMLHNPKCKERFATLDPKVNKCVRYELRLAAEVTDGWRDGCTERRQKEGGGGGGYLEKGLKCRGNEQLKVGGIERAL